jgi:universal stress protein E
MVGFRSIVFGPLTFAGGVDALRRVREFADRHDTTVTLFEAVPGPSRLGRLLHGEQLENAVADSERRTAQHRLDRLRGTLGDRAADAVVAMGDPAAALVEQVTAAGHDLVIVTLDDHDHGARTTLKRLERSCPVPVWVLRPTRARVQRVLAAVDTDPNHAELNQAVVRIAADMAAFGGGELHLLHAWTMYGESALRSGTFTRVTPAELDAMLLAENTERAKALDALVHDAGVADAPWQIHLVKGSPAATVIDAVQRRRINLVVLGTAARTGLAGMVIGNTAEAILSEVPCSVITVPVGAGSAEPVDPA